MDCFSFDPQMADVGSAFFFKLEIPNNIEFSTWIICFPGLLIHSSDDRMDYHFLASFEFRVPFVRLNYWLSICHAFLPSFSPFFSATKWEQSEWAVKREWAFRHCLLVVYSLLLCLHILHCIIVVKKKEKRIDKYLQGTLRWLLGPCEFLDGRGPYPDAAERLGDKRLELLQICPFGKVLQPFDTSLQ